METVKYVAKNVYTRQLQHRADILNTNPSNVIAKHYLIQHEGNIAKFKLTATGAFRKHHFNSKSDFRQASLVRIVTTSGLLDDEVPYTSKFLLSD